MRKAILLLYCIVPFICKSQTITNTSRKKIGKYKFVTLNRNVLNKSDTMYYMYFQNPKYQHIVDLIQITLSSSELEELANAITIADTTKFDKDNEMSLNLSNGISLTKGRGIGLWLRICSKNLECTGITMNDARRMQADIYDELKIPYTE